MTDTQTNETVLLVDDDPLILRMYQKKLADDGYTTITAVNGEEALEHAAHQKPDIILLDVMMPKMNGVETLKELKAKEETADVPVIFLTNLGDNIDDVEKAKELGALDYLVKANTDLSELSERIQKALSAARNVKQQFGK